MENKNAKAKYILAIDQGTTSCRTVVIDQQGKIVAADQKEFTQHFPKAGWVEHDAVEIWNTQLTTLFNATQKAKALPKDIAGLGITNQRETIVVWEKATGYPVYNALVWQDQRTAEACAKMAEDGKLVQKVREKTGLIINPYFSATKLAWILDNVPKARERAAKGELLAGTIDSWLIWKLTGGKEHVTDVTNASRTLLMNVKTLKWDPELLEIFRVPASVLPTIKSSSDDFGFVEPALLSKTDKTPVPIAGVAGDQQAALFGQQCLRVGDVKNTYGTGCFTLVNIGEKFVLSKNNLLTTVAWKLGDKPAVYAFEGSVFIAGAAIKWLRDSVNLLYDTALIEQYIGLARKGNDGQRVYFVPAFTGLGAPYWDPSARGAIFGLERGTKREHLVQATIESIAYQSHDLISAMSSDLGKPVSLLKVDGGACNSDYMMQFQADISGVDVVRPVNKETTATGAAFLAGLQVGFWKSTDELAKVAAVDETFKRKLAKEDVAELLKGWNAAVRRTRGWLTDLTAK